MLSVIIGIYIIYDFLITSNHRNFINTPHDIWYLKYNINWWLPCGIGGYFLALLVTIVNNVIYHYITQPSCVIRSVVISMIILNQSANDQFKATMYNN